MCNIFVILVVISTMMKTTMQINDFDIVKEVLGGNTNAFRHIIRNHQKLVSHVVFRMVPHETDREEICQEVFIKIFQNLKNFKFNAKLSTWIASVAYNESVNYLKKNKMRFIDDKPNGDDSMSATEQIASDDDNLHDILQKKDLKASIMNGLNELAPHYRTILTLYHMDELSYGEIGDITKLPEGTVKNYLFRARKQLKDILISKYKEEELWT